MGISFRFNEEKALAALGYVASEEPGLTPLYVSKILFFAEKWHINRYGRPILGDNYVAMPKGPVPSNVKNYIDEKWEKIHKPAEFDSRLKITRGWYRKLYPGDQMPRVDLLSETDKQCIREAIAFCKDKSEPELEKIAHLEKAWLQAPRNRYMDYKNFVDDDNPNRTAIISLMQEQALYGML